ncbi:MAG: sensor histidine kinase N-terminal domain-containing protein [Rhodocyclaceae bacterium]|nr:sensor histidine kinase N-terminal domain-containing protein [Rhodocyclaceae bacterium]MBX3667070.1 sensor histidine kinase N-terminal domain-containing protein [Rhodocyclaceae bacterium]
MVGLRRLRPGAGKGEPAELNSLFGEILDWLLAPLLFLWPISVALTHHVASQIANVPYDKTLAENVSAIARLVRANGPQVSLNLPAPARALLRANDEDTVYFQLRGARGEWVAGDADIPAVAVPEDMQPDVVYYRDEELAGEDVRVAYLFMNTGAADTGRLALVQVAETRNKRSALASRIVSGVLLPQFAIIPLAVLLVYVGLGRGIAPLRRLQGIIARRRPSDLSPITMRGLPEEVRPVIEAFNDMMERLEQNQQAQQRFIADAAHQMRTPLTGLKMQADLALHEEDPHELHRSLEHIRSAADRAAHLINQLLSLARAEASSETINAVESLDLERVIPEIVREWVTQARAKHIDFGVETTGWPLVIDGSPALLRELFKNLIDNAIKYTPKGGTVTVRLKSSEFAIVEVEDSGVGIPESERDLVFERFYRVLGNSADGSGLGLAIVREIADLHRANVLIRSGIGGRGSVFQVVFPRARVRPIAAETAPEPAS